MEILREHFRSEEAFIRAREVSKSLDNLMSKDLSSADSARALNAISNEARGLAEAVLKQAKSDHAGELFNALTEVMTWYRNRTTPEMPEHIQERALDALWQAKGSPATPEQE